MDMIKEKEGFPPFLEKQFYELKGDRYTGTKLPPGKQNTATRKGVITIFSFIFIGFVLYQSIKSSLGFKDLSHVYPFLCMLFIVLYFFIWNNHLGTILINEKERIWPKQGIYSFHKGDPMQTIFGVIILGMFLVLAPWFFTAILFTIFLIVKGVTYKYGISWKQPLPMELKLSKISYFAGDTLRFTIKTTAKSQKRYIQLYNLETIKVKRKTSSGVKWQRHSKVLHYDWCCLEKGESEVRFSIPTSGFVGTDFSKEEATGWIIRINNEQASIHDEPYLMPIFDR